VSSVARDHRPVDARDVATYDHETDLLVVGFGCAGACAAIEGREAGAEVTVLEGASGPGGASAASGGEIYLGGGTATQKAAGFEDTTEAMYAFLEAALGPHTDAEKLRRYCDDSPAHHDWLVDHGLTFEPSLWDGPTWMPPSEDGLMWLGENSWPYDRIAPPVPRGHRPPVGHFGGVVLMERLVEAATAAGSVVHTDTSATQLIVDAGRVVGVVARRFGDTVTYRARRGVVLATGGFVDDDAMLADHAPALVGHGKVSAGRDDGSGISMGLAVGASVRRMACVQTAVLFPPEHAARGILVNARGQRFINEDTYPGLISHAAVHTQPGPAWIIVDEEGFEAVTVAERWGAVPAVVSEDVADLEEAAGLPSGALAATLEVYNAHAARGEDPVCHKAARWLRPLEGPLAAIDTSAGMGAIDGSGSRSTGAAGFTLGGLRTSVDGEVLDTAGVPIHGLYAAGRASSGIHGQNYISGTSLGDGTYFGRRAGRAAAGTAVPASRGAAVR
jgi:3-oxo-5alpha-steroid 4-dehydrogenase